MNLATLLRHRRVKSAARGTVRFLRWAAPTQKHVVVTGFPDSEGNSVEVIRALLEQTSKDVVWLTESSSREQALRILGPVEGADRLTVLPKRSGLAFGRYLTARLTFFTHGLYLSPVPPRRKPVVNLWHGDGPKAPLSDPDTVRPRATYLVSGTRLFGDIKADFLHVPVDRLLVTGNPRWNQFRNPATDDELRTLGIDPTRPFLLYMPTFRSSISIGSRSGWSDGSTADHTANADMLAGLVAGARTAEAQVVVKPHPLDAEAYDVSGALTVTNGQLGAAGVLLYRLLARAAGLVTDYSSVWTDFLVLDKPLGFVLGDLDAYASGPRGLNVDDVRALLPGPALYTPVACEEFAAQAVADSPQMKEMRRESARRIGLAATSGSATVGLIGELRLSP